MTNNELTIEPFDFRNSDTASYEAATTFFNRMQVETEKVFNYLAGSGN